MRSLITIVLLLLFFLLPILTGYAKLPTEPITPEKLGLFLGEILAYWIAMLRKMIEVLQNSMR